MPARPLHLTIVCLPGVRAGWPSAAGEFEYFCWCEVLCSREEQDKVLALDTQLANLTALMPSASDAASRRKLDKEARTLKVTLSCAPMCPRVAVAACFVH